MILHQFSRSSDPMKFNETSLSLLNTNVTIGIITIFVKNIILVMIIRDVGVRGAPTQGLVSITATPQKLGTGEGGRPFETKAWMRTQKSDESSKGYTVISITPGT